jgi:hypothetical protein
MRTKNYALKTKEATAKIKALSEKKWYDNLSIHEYYLVASYVTKEEWRIIHNH